MKHYKLQYAEKLPQEIQEDFCRIMDPALIDKIYQEKKIRCIDITNAFSQLSPSQCEILRDIRRYVSIVFCMSMDIKVDYKKPMSLLRRNRYKPTNFLVYKMLERARDENIEFNMVKKWAIKVVAYDDTNLRLLLGVANRDESVSFGEVSKLIEGKVVAYDNTNLRLLLVIAKRDENANFGEVSKLIEGKVIRYNEVHLGILLQIAKRDENASFGEVSKLIGGQVELYRAHHLGMLLQIAKRDRSISFSDIRSLIEGNTEEYNMIHVSYLISVLARSDKRSQSLSLLNELARSSQSPIMINDEMRIKLAHYLGNTKYDVSTMIEQHDYLVNNDAEYR